MELELKYVGLEGFRMILDRLLIQEETQEGIVPDTLPDITRIVESSGQAFLEHKELSSGNIKVSGSIRSSVMYIPEGDTEVREMEFKVPFLCSVDDPAFRADCSLWTVPRVADVDVQMINPRKVLVRVELAVEIRVFAREGQNVCSETHGGEPHIQQYTEEREICVISQVSEKSISFSDVIALPASKPRAIKILRSRIETGQPDAKVIGEKAILKGEAELVILYQSEDGPIIGRFPLPYSQVMEASGVGEESETFASSALTELECELQEGEPGAVSVKVGMLLQLAVLEKKQIKILTDAYSTDYPVDVEEGYCSLCAAFGESKKRKTIRQFCECAIAAKNVIDAFLTVGRVISGLEDGEKVFRADTAVKILFLTDDNELCSVRYSIPALCEWDESDEVPFGKCVPVGEMIAVPVTGGIEVRTDVEFAFLSVRDTSVAFVKNMNILPNPDGDEERPSVILRKVGESERLWDIAKFYRSTVEEITRVNEIGTEGASEDMMLLIPRHR